MQVTMENFLRDKITSQQVFDFAMVKLIEQGEASCVDLACLYDNGAGKHCAIGWLLLDRKPPEEGNPVDSLFDCGSAAFDPDLESLLKDGHTADEQDRLVDFLVDLQNVHDYASTDNAGHSFLPSLRKRARKFALEYGLDASVLAEGADE